MRIKSTLLFLLIAASLLANNNQLFDSANTYYSAGDFEKAIGLYEEILSKGFSSPELYYNLGNAYYRSNSLSGAILNFERALRMSPGDGDIQFNLEIARTYLVDRIEEIPPFFLKKWIQSISSLLTSDGWAWLSVLSFCFILAFSALFIFSRSLFVRKIVFAIAVVLLFLSSAGFYLSWEQKRRIQSPNEAIITASMVVIKSSPDENATDLFILHEGTKVFIRERLGQWIEISLLDGKKGWVREQAFEII